MSTTLEKLEKMRSKKQLNFGQEFYGNSNKVTIVKKIHLLLLYSPVYACGLKMSTTISGSVRKNLHIMVWVGVCGVFIAAAAAMCAL